MNGAAFDPALWAKILLGAVVALSLVRLGLWQRGAPVEAKASSRRLGLLFGLQLAAGGLLFLTLFPPDGPARSGTLVVATRGAPATIEIEPGDHLVALPEAGPIADAIRLPDLATALRRFPQAGRLRILGQGLPPRDQSPVGLPIDFEPGVGPPGLVDLALPRTISPGGGFSVGGQVGTLRSGSVELVDPAGAIVDRASVAAGGRFVLTSEARAPGLVLFDLRLRDATGALVERVAVPVETRAQTPPRVLVLAGAPGAETKYLSRWAQDAGIDLRLDIDLGAGVRLGDTSTPLTLASLGAFDLVMIDDRRWEALGPPAHAALASAVDQGLGLVLRPTGPLSAATRRDWTGLGVSLAGGDESVPLQLDPPSSAVISPRKGQPDAGADAQDLPELARRDLTHQGSEAISILRDADGATLASRQARGRGRVGIWTVSDSYALVLTGRPERYGQIWSALFAELARAGDDWWVEIDGIARAGARVALCRLEGAAQVVGRDGTARPLRIDPTTGEAACAAYWPQAEGWHLVRDGRSRETAFYVHPAGAAASVSMASDRSATLEMASRPASDRPTPAPAPGSPWPWFAMLLVVLGALWWLERNRRPPTADG